MAKMNKIERGRKVKWNLTREIEWKMAISCILFSLATVQTPALAQRLKAERLWTKIFNEFYILEPFSHFIFFFVPINFIWKSFKAMHLRNKMQKMKENQKCSMFQCNVISIHVQRNEFRKYFMRTRMFAIYYIKMLLVKIVWLFENVMPSVYAIACTIF